jgi:hypothetical protein
MPKPDGPNSRWSTDFVHDQLANGRRFRGCCRERGGVSGLA